MASGRTGSLVRRYRSPRRAPATTHWQPLDLLAELDPSNNGRADERLVDDGDTITAASIFA